MILKKLVSLRFKEQRSQRQRLKKQLSLTQVEVVCVVRFNGVNFNRGYNDEGLGSRLRRHNADHRRTGSGVSSGSTDSGTGE